MPERGHLSQLSGRLSVHLQRPIHRQPVPALHRRLRHLTMSIRQLHLEQWPRHLHLPGRLHGRPVQRSHRLLCGQAVPERGHLSQPPGPLPVLVSRRLHGQPVSDLAGSVRHCQQLHEWRHMFARARAVRFHVHVRGRLHGQDLPAGDSAVCPAAVPEQRCLHQRYVLVFVNSLESFSSWVLMVWSGQHRDLCSSS